MSASTSGGRSLSACVRARRSAVAAGSAGGAARAMTRARGGGAPGRDRKALRRFFDLLGEERCAKIELVSADGADWIAEVVNERCPNAALCLDPFHVVQWATAALDEVRREVWNAARRAGQKAEAKALKGARFVLWRNPQDLSGRQA